MPAMNTNSITAHHAMPLSDWITCGLNTKAWYSGKAAPSTPGPSRMPVMICTTTSGAKYSVRPKRHTSHGTVKMIAIAIRKISVVFITCGIALVPPCPARPGHRV